MNDKKQKRIGCKIGNSKVPCWVLAIVVIVIVIILIV